MDGVTRVVTCVVTYVVTPQTRFHIGLTHMQKGDVGAAERELRIAIRCDPPHAEV